MKRVLLLLLTLIIVFCGCSTKASESSNISSIDEISNNIGESSYITQSNLNTSSINETCSNTSESSEEESSFWSNISGTFIDYVGSKNLNTFVEEYYQTDKTGDEFFIEFCKQFNLTREEILSVMYTENEILAGMGDKAYYPESKMKEVMKILFSDENIELTQRVDVLTKTSGQYGLIFGDTEIDDVKDIENPWYYSIPNKLQMYVGVRQINQWVSDLKKREDYNIVNFVRYFNVPVDVFDNAPFLLDQKVYDQVRKELYGESQTQSNVSSTVTSQ